MPEVATDRHLRCDLLVFDLDGTLIDSQQDLSNAVNATLAYVSRPSLLDTQIAEFIGDGAAMLVRRSLEATGGADEAMMAVALPFFLQYYHDHKLDFTYVYPGAIAELKHIQRAVPGLPMAILTNKPFRPSRAICDGLGLSAFFFQNYGGDSFSLKKPNPFGMHALMREAAAMLGREVSAARTVLVGDSHVDVQTARNAGTLCLGCSYGLAPERLREAKPDIIVDSPTEWLGALRRLLA
jgi:phosphoglycolate phosphatase